MGAGEHRVVLPLSDEVDGLGAGETGAGGEIMRLAVAILGGNAGEDAVGNRRIFPIAPAAVGSRSVELTSRFALT